VRQSSPSSRSPSPLSPPSQLGDNGRHAFAEYLSRNPPKAFAVAPDGSFGWRSRMTTAADAEREALAACATQSKHCALYAIDDGLYQ
jgi:hypothetical protein